MHTRVIARVTKNEERHIEKERHIEREREKKSRDRQTNRQRKCERQSDAQGTARRKTKGNRRENEAGILKQ